MARSVNGGFKDLRPKPPVPFHYRIDPTEKVLDELDKLEAELAWRWENTPMHADQYEQYKAVLDGRREAIHNRRLKAIGEYISPAKQHQVALQIERDKTRAAVWAAKNKPQQAELSYLQKKLILVTIIMLAFLFLWH
jgi:hypothetical protein